MSAAFAAFGLSYRGSLRARVRALIWETTNWSAAFGISLPRQHSANAARRRVADVAAQRLDDSVLKSIHTKRFSESERT